ncbi:phage capsid protein [Breoghania sp.]|uniref:phage capsid protein n=1 Tax=Breoghania sp. TaxID=2065378 RepID=UPI002AA631C1|nr:phage capsid protein [Breoghania sp.]
MTQTADQHFIEQFNRRAHHKYQAQGFMLRSTVMPAERIEGTKAYFPVFGKGQAKKKRRGVDATPMNPDRARPEATLETWEAFDYIYYQDLSRTNVNERENIATIGANALGRATDNELVDKWNGTASTGAPIGSGLTPFLDKDGMPAMVGDGTEDFGLGFAMRMCSALEQADVPTDGRWFCPLPSIQWNLLMTYKQFNSADWVGGDLSFIKGGRKAKFWNGVHWFLAPGEYFRQPGGPATVDICLWHYGAMGWANNTTLKSWWDWENKKGAWSMRMESEGAAAAVLPNGLVRGRFKAFSELGLEP